MRAGAWLVALVIAGQACGPLPPAGTPDGRFLDDAWRAYTRAYLDPAGYVLDRTRGGGEVTSEAQAYALLRAAWMGDRGTFDRVLAWTERALGRPDGLFAWRWSPAGGGRVLDANVATDADQDIAFALVIAADRFGHPPFLARAARIVRAIRTVTGIDVAGGWFPAAGNWAVDERIVNLSYFAPYAYPYFARLDPDGDWEAVIPVGYALLARASSDAGRRLPPDFMTVSADGAPGPLPAASTLPQRFSFDGIRIAWRVEFDCRLHRREAACEGTGTAVARTLGARFEQDGRLVSDYDLSGQPATDLESLSFYGCVLPALRRLAPETAARMTAARLAPADLRAVLTRNDRYYDLNWLWFGTALADEWLAERTPPPRSIPGR